jgi:hypothetical protein
MPNWTSKEERQYRHIAVSCVKSGKHSKKRCKSIAAATVNTQRRDRLNAFRRLNKAIRRLKKS